MELQSSPLEQLLCNESMQKTLSKVYKDLFVERPKELRKCRDKWSSLVPNFQRDDWDDMRDHPFGALVSAHDRYIQFKILHRVYYTPARIASIYGSGDAACWRCTTTPADFDHIFWHCQQTWEFWAGGH